MALNFTANQYETAFSPNKLCNWGIAKSSVVPKKHNDVTKIIANDRGHLLPGLRKFAKNPWTGLYQGTYDLPRRITRKIAEQMANGEILSSWEKRSAHIPTITDQTEITKGITNNSSPDKENKLIENDLPTSVSPCETNVPHCSVSPSTSSNKSNTILHDIKNHAELKKSEVNKYDDEPILSDVFTNELVAKNLRQSNQKHHRLPDAVDNDSYNALQMRRKTNPGLALDVDPSSSAIGCKVFHSPGPTQCSKLKVFRPKTAATREIKNEENNRPKTTSRIKKKSKPLSEMDLAIYWDIPASTELNNYSNPAPAVFAVVPADDYRKEVTDAEVPSLIGSDNNSEGKELAKKFTHTNPSAVMGVVRAESLPRSPESDSLPNQIVKKECSPLSSECSKSKRQFSASSLRAQKSDEKLDANCSYKVESSFKLPQPVNASDHWNGQQRRSKSSPNLANVGVQVNGTKFGRPCVACEHKKTASSGKIEKTDEYKCAFKAGKLNNYKVDREIIERLQRSKNLRVPKPKVPFARKNYSIGTLAPPFSIWPKTGGHDYPDHWRLASIYQHSYKPMEARKAPLIKTVFQ